MTGIEGNDWLAIAVSVVLLFLLVLMHWRP